MQLYINTTSPFVRPVRIAIAEKGLEGRVKTEIVDPWGDPEEFLAANPAGRVPTLVTDDGTAIAEASLILRYLDVIAPEPALVPADDVEQTLATAAIAIGATEAATAIIIGRKSSERFDTDMVGTRRFRTMANAFRRLNAAPPRDFAERVDLANITAITALDYILFRYPDRDWLADLPPLKAWHERQQDRPSLRATYPYI
ncbi:MAG: glutathione S-transferase family protein [Alphaproteobacteria bacterium]